MADDKEMFDSAVSDETPPEQNENATEAATEAPTEAEPSKARDEQGRFASKAPEPSQEVAEEPAQQPKDESEARIPSWRLAEEAQRRREAEQQLNDMRREFREMQLQMAQMARPQAQNPQQQPQVPDPFADPEGYTRQLQQTFEGRLQQIQLQNSLQFARYAHKEAFDNAYEAFIDHAHRTRDAATYQRVMSSPDPGEALVQWYKEQELVRELGGMDLKSFLDRQREEWMKDPATQAKVIEAFKATQQAQPSSNVTNLPPSISRGTSAAPQHESPGGADDASMFAFAIKG